MTTDENPGMETDLEGFLKIAEPFILIAGSSDVLEEMEIAQRVAQDVLREFGKHDVMVYVWDIRVGPEGLDQRRTMQCSIPRSSSDKCQGVIYIVGERIGLALEDGFDANRIGGVEAWTQSGRYRLAPDWPNDPDQIRELLDEGCFPLTGGVFEFLDARGHRSDQYPEGKPVWSCLLADRPIKRDEKEIALNSSRWFNKHTAEMTRAERASWDEEEYAPQAIAVHNWMRAFDERGLNQNPTSTHEELRRGVRGFVSERICRKRGASGNPYRELEYYDIGHGERFVGRDALVNTCIARLLERFDDNGQPPVIRLVGPSGCGKSSVLRAGILRGLTGPEHRRRFHVAAFRPEDFQSATGQRKPVVFTVLEAIAKQAQLAIPNSEIFDAINCGADAPKRAAEIVSNALRQSHTSGACLVLGLDQFEEIIDMLMGREAGNWHPLLRFVEQAMRHSNIGIVYTLESSRKSHHDQLKLGDAFNNAAEEPVEFTSAFINEVIRSPFVETGYKLANDVLDELKKNLSKLQDSNDHAAHSSVLPLLALRLHHLWKFVSERYEPDKTRSLMLFDPSVDAEDAISVAMLNEGGETLDFQDIIQQQAANAWKRAKVGDITEEALDFFLQPLVGVESDRLQLVAASRKPPYNNELKLIESFSQHRLVVGAGDGLARLVHEAVLEYWKEAKDWYKRRREFLVMKEQLRDRAKAWKSEGRPKIRRSKKTASEVPKAAEILATYIRHWSLDNARIPSSDRMLYEYCLEIFSLSQTPRSLAQMFPMPGRSHVDLAAAYGIVPLLKKFARRDPDSLHMQTEHPENRSRTPLGHAAWGQFDAVKFLLKAEATPFTPDSQSWPPVAGAIKVGRQDIFMALMDAAAEQNSKDRLEGRLACPHGNTLLHLAAEADNHDAARDLIQRYNFSPVSKNERQWTPIHLAAAYDAKSVFDLLYEFQPSRLETNNEPDCLIIAAANGSQSIVDRILDDQNQQEALEKHNLKVAALKTAIENRHPECARLILRNVNPNEVEFCPFQSLLEQWNPKDKGNDIEKLIETLRVLLEDERIDVNVAVITKKISLVKYINEHGWPKGLTADYMLRSLADIRAPKDLIEALTEQVNNKDVEKFFETLGDWIAKFYVTVKVEATPLELAKDVELAQRLLLQDPRIDLTKPIHKEGPTGFFVALKLGEWGAVRRYIHEHGLPEGLCTDDRGNTVLHLLTKPNAPTDLIETQISQATNEQLNSVNKRGQTPFTRALNAKNWGLASRMIDTERLSHGVARQGFQGDLYVALKSGAPDALLKKLATSTPELLSKTDSFGWTILHHIAAHNHKDWADRIAPHINDLATWELADSLGRRPVDLAGETIRSMAPKVAEYKALLNGKKWDNNAGWHKIDAKSAKPFIKHTKEALKTANKSCEANRWIVERGALSFYPGSGIFKVRAKSWEHPNRALYFLENEKEIFHLNGTSPPIHKFNDQYELSLNGDNALDYLRFFCFFVRGEEGPFFIFDHAEEVIFDADMSSNDRELVKTLAHPALIIAETEDGFEAIAHVFYSNALFGAYFAVKTTGMIEMQDDFPLISDLSGSIDMPLT